MRLADLIGTKFYVNCKRQRKVGAKICQDCPLRWMIEDLEGGLTLSITSFKDDVAYQIRQVDKEVMK